MNSGLFGSRERQRVGKSPLAGARGYPANQSLKLLGDLNYLSLTAGSYERERVEFRLPRIVPTSLPPRISQRALSPAHRIYRADKVLGSVTSVLTSVRSVKKRFSSEKRDCCGLGAVPEHALRHHGASARPLPSRRSFVRRPVAFQSCTKRLPAESNDRPCGAIKMPSCQNSGASLNAAHCF